MPKIPGKESKSKVEDWMVDSVIGFLSSPLWTTPVMNFIEHQCIVFDNEDENKFVYTEIHEKYRKLIETLIEGYLEELKITPKQFLKACEKATPEHPQYDKVVFETVIAADDFLTFKQLMVAMNMSLEMQALKLLYELYGVVLDAADQATLMGMSPEDASRLGLNQRATDDRREEEEDILEEAIRLSKAAYERRMRDLDDETDEMRRVIEDSLAESERLARKAQRIQDEFDRELERAIRQSLLDAQRRRDTDEDSEDGKRRRHDDAVVSDDGSSDGESGTRRTDSRGKKRAGDSRSSPSKAKGRSADSDGDVASDSNSDDGVVVTSSMRDVSAQKHSARKTDKEREKERGKERDRDREGSGSKSSVAAGHRLPRPPSGRRGDKDEQNDGRRSRGDKESESDGELDYDDLIEGRSKPKRRSTGDSKSDRSDKASLFGKSSKDGSKSSKSPTTKAGALAPVRSAGAAGGNSRPTSAKGSATSNWLARAKEEAAVLEEHKKATGTTKAVSSGAGGDDLEVRARHLREQRDNLLEFKRQQREKVLQKYAEKNDVADLTESVRQRVEDVTDGDGVAGGKPSKEDEERMALRRALAMKLRQDVIETAQIGGGRKY